MISKIAHKISQHYRSYTPEQIQSYRAIFYRAAEDCPHDEREQRKWLIKALACHMALKEVQS